MEVLKSVFDPELLAAAMRMTSPILLAALGGMLCSRVGTFNVALEGFMLIGAFVAVAGSYYAGSALVGSVAAVVITSAVAWVYSVVTLRFKGDTLVVGIALNLFAVGLTTFLMRFLWGVRGTFIDPAIVGMPRWQIPVIKEIPVLGPALSGHTPIVYLSFVIVLVINYILFHTPFGLQLRAVGQKIEAANSLGIPSLKIQYIAVVSSGALSGLAGAQLSLGLVTLFGQSMTAGRGFLSVVAVILGQALPFGVLGSSLLFGVAEGLTIRLQGLRIPSQFVLMLPYVITILAMVFLRERQRRVQLPPEAYQAAKQPPSKAPNA